MYLGGPYKVLSGLHCLPPAFFFSILCNPEGNRARQEWNIVFNRVVSHKLSKELVLGDLVSINAFQQSQARTSPAASPVISLGIFLLIS